MGHSLSQKNQKNQNTAYEEFLSEHPKTGPDSKAGKMLREYWHPVCLSEELTDLPKAIRILGEDLVAFRDKLGNVGVLHRHCSHRGTSLEYGIVSEQGIRCCYHG